MDRNRVSPEKVEQMVKDSRKAQGLPPKIEDPAALSKLARLLLSGGGKNER